MSASAVTLVGTMSPAIYINTDAQIYPTKIRLARISAALTVVGYSISPFS
jgi:preprotein translocase subunit SecF